MFSLLNDFISKFEKFSISFLSNRVILQPNLDKKFINGILLIPNPTIATCLFLILVLKSLKSCLIYPPTK